MERSCSITVYLDIVQPSATLFEIEAEQQMHIQFYVSEMTNLRA